MTSNVMLEEFQSTFFESPGEGEEKSLSAKSGNKGSLEIPLSDDYGSLFDDIDKNSSLQEITMIGKSNDILYQESDSNDEEIAHYLAQFNNRSSTYSKSQEESTSRPAECPSADLSIAPRNCKASSCTSSLYLDENSQENDPVCSNIKTNVPKINVFELEEKGKCTNRNAINARLNRMRKKQYLSDLERKVASLSSENAKINDKLKVKTKRLTEAQQEITYLRSVISNQKGLMSLLNNISNTEGVKLNASLVFSNNNLEKSDGPKRNEAVKCAGVGCKRLMQDTATNLSDHVSVKKTRNGMYLVNEKEKRSKLDPTLQKTTDESCSSNPDKDHTQKGFSIPLDQDPSYETTGGVCLHVSNDQVSIELCSSCASSAKNSWEIAGDHSYFKHDGDDII